MRAIEKTKAGAEAVPPAPKRAQCGLMMGHRFRALLFSA
jgi:hypothetical protein